jgi:hypothetical protein
MPQRSSAGSPAATPAAATATIITIKVRCCFMVEGSSCE